MQGDAAGGALAGTTVHAVPQAIATGEAFGPEAVEWATLYKLLRVAMLVPLVVLLALVVPSRSGGQRERKAVGVPHFVWLFVVASALRASGDPLRLPVVDADRSIYHVAHATALGHAHATALDKASGTLLGRSGTTPAPCRKLPSPVATGFV